MLHYAPRLDDLLADPLIQKVMRADAVDPSSLKWELTEIGLKVAARKRERVLAINPTNVRMQGEIANPTAAESKLFVKAGPCESRLCGC